MNISPLRISTMTVTGNLGAMPNLQKLYDDGSIIPYWYIGEGIIKIELSGQKKGISSDDILHRSTKIKKHFFNQSSLVFRLYLGNNNYKEINIKMFKNGGFQMTGISSEEMSRNALIRLIDLNKDRGIWASPPYIHTFSIRMINSDYTIGKSIRRERLHRILVENYGLWSSYEPTIYQGVNTKFYWNKSRSEETPPGICVCPTPCEGGGSGYKIGECKKITISPFRTGSIIITGAKHMEQLHDAYAFMNSVLETHAAHILRDDVVEKMPMKKNNPPSNTMEILGQKMRASPRNIVKIPSALCGKNLIMGC
jgi:TATA-box binding protein (TBP) (component of TFIID and TFIIIB)